MTRLMGSGTSPTARSVREATQQQSRELHPREVVETGDPEAEAIDIDRFSPAFHSGEVAPFAYRPVVRDQLLEFGVRPHADTEPCLVRGHLNELYTYELRTLRRALVDEEASSGRRLRREYSSRVHALRMKYALLAAPVETWIEVERVFESGFESFELT